MLKDVEVFLWTEIQQGTGDYVAPMLEAAKLRNDPAKFAVGSRTAEETQGTCMIEGGKEKTHPMLMAIV